MGLKWLLCKKMWFFDKFSFKLFENCSVGATKNFKIAKKFSNCAKNARKLTKKSPKKQTNGKLKIIQCFYSTWSDSVRQ